MISTSSQIIQPGIPVSIPQEIVTPFRGDRVTRSRTDIHFPNRLHRMVGSDAQKLKPAIVQDPLAHTMEMSLFRYLDIKIHPYIQEKRYREIVVIGDYDRSGGIASNEKGGKRFNWQRPTAELADDVLLIKCVPGDDYVMHYASLIASYLALTNQNHTRVSYIPPSAEACWRLMETSNLKDLPITESVVYGFGLPQIFNATDWAGEGPFKVARVPGTNQAVTLLGCEYCVWGDIAGRLVQYLAEVKQVKKFIYIGKLGSLNPAYEPNCHLATGHTSLVNGEWVQWDSLFEAVAEDEVVKKGVHYTISSPLLETKEWLQTHRGFDFIDPEIGHMGRAAARASIPFGYMHIISDNVAQRYSEDLSNERQQSVIAKRKRLLSKARTLIEAVI